MSAAEPLPLLGESDPAPRRSVRLESLAVSMAGAQYRAALRRLYFHWRAENDELFGGALREPLLLVGLPAPIRARGAWAATARGAVVPGATLIKFHGSLFVEHRREGFSVPKRDQEPYQCLALVHEMVHQWELEVLRLAPEEHVPHGAPFVAKADELAAQIGLLPADDLPEFWPFGVPLFPGRRGGRGRVAGGVR